MATVSWKGFEKTRDRLARLAVIPDEDFLVATDELQRIVHEDNRKGVLAGTDRDGKPLAAVTYRGGKGRATAARKGDLFGAVSGTFQGHGPQASGLHGNLTAAEYKQLTGPPLAPRGANSRVITNLTTDAHSDGPGRWEVIGVWEEVVSTKGVPFLAAHFQGKGRLPRRDLAGVRPWGMKEAGKAVRKWARWLLKK